ncbi:hypothetical protein NQ317_003495 [Molorchus minor]|uniref:Uncharacterized protein n=1 Tax=Molorchus minor TaxID=1323400 RepID=A0ABQ9J151_9CUCU|nr:hypothetical protein NQ317_003495 [Molorchus minor]
MRGRLIGNIALLLIAFCLFVTFGVLLIGVGSKSENVLVLASIASSSDGSSSSELDNTASAGSLCSADRTSGLMRSPVDKPEVPGCGELGPDMRKLSELMSPEVLLDMYVLPYTNLSHKTMVYQNRGKHGSYP